MGFLARRIALLIPVLLGTTFITFFISRVAVRDPARAWAGIKAGPATLAAFTARYHLNAPIYVQYYYYMQGLVTGNWGVSPTTGRPVLSDIEFFFPATIELALTAFLITVVLGILLGVLAAIHYNKKIDHAIKVIYLTGYSSPPFFVAVVLILLLGYVYRVFPTQGQLSQNLVPPTHITGMYVVDSLLTGNWVDLKDSIWHIILPGFALALTYFGIITRVTRTSMFEVLQKEFIRGSYAKGFTKWATVWKHALRNALIPTTTVLGLLLGSLLGGTIVIETIFSWPGIGYYATQAILNFDFPSVMGVTVLFTLSVVIANFLADMVYGILDPRIKL